jgi:SAM-dependent methyltransferase
MANTRRSSLLAPQLGLLRQRLRRTVRPAWLGTLRRTAPLSDTWGFDRGTPIDRYYIERFLDRNRQDIQGRVLEIKDSSYTHRFGMNVERAEVLDVDPENRLATFVADLAVADAIPADHFDCFILTQTLHLIPDLRSAIRHSHRLLRPGGVLLATLPAVSRISRGVGPGGDFWRFTGASGAALFGDHFGYDRIEVHSYGSVLTAIAFLTGMAREELSRRELETHDPYFPVVVSVRAVKG